MASEQTPLTLLSLSLSEDLPLHVQAGDDKAALFDSLNSVAVLEACTSLAWGFDTSDRQHIILLIGSGLAFDRQPITSHAEPVDRMGQRKPCGAKASASDPETCSVLAHASKSP